MAAKKKSGDTGPTTPTPAGGPSLARRVEAVVGPGGAERTDRYIAETLRCLSRSQLKARGATIEVEGRVSKLSRPLVEGERLVITWTEEPPPGLTAETLPLDILYEDNLVIVVNKAQGMVTHPGAGNRSGTLANAILGHLAASAHAGRPGSGLPGAHALPKAAPLRGGIVHRLDKDTSGVIIVAKDAATQAFLAAQFKDRTTRKEYVAITAGIPAARDRGDAVDSSGRTGWHRVESRLGRDRRDRKRFAEVESGGRLAVTDWRVVATYGNFALVHLRPRTGRTHQLRVHLTALGSPIVGDPIYGGRKSSVPEASSGGPDGRRHADRRVEPGLMLHAWKLAIRLPGSQEPSQFIASIPRRFTSLLRRLEARYGRKLSERS